MCTKGPGLCHGIGGGICALVDLYTATGGHLWLNRAQQFAIMLVRLLAELSPNAGNPYSLFEGRAGAMYALGIVQALSDGTSRQQICMSGPDRWSSCFPGLGL